MIVVLVATVPILLTNEHPRSSGLARGGRSEILRAYLGVVATGIVLAIVAEALAIVGPLWMIRIWRGPTRDAPPDWRYRE